MAFPSLTLRETNMFDGDKNKSTEQLTEPYQQNSIFYFVKLHKLSTCIVILIIYLFIGALGFRFFERGYDEQQFGKYQSFLTNISHLDNLDGDKALEFMKEAIEAYDKGFDLRHMIERYQKKKDFKNRHRQRWMFAGSLLFSTTVITTIGYGHLCPGTIAGRIFCVIYAFIGIPLCLVTAKLIGDNYMMVYKRAVLQCGARVAWRRLLHLLAFISGVSLFFIGPAGLFIYTEEWSYWNGLYASFIALTTIGFGDYVPGCYGEDSNWYKILLSIWIYTGLAFFGLLMTFIDEVIHCMGRRLESKFGRKQGDLPVTPCIKTVWN